LSVKEVEIPRKLFVESWQEAKEFSECVVVYENIKLDHTQTCKNLDAMRELNEKNPRPETQSEFMLYCDVVESLPETTRQLEEAVVELAKSSKIAKRQKEEKKKKIQSQHAALDTNEGVLKLLEDRGTVEKLWQSLEGRAKVAQKKTIY